MLPDRKKAEGLRGLKRRDNQAIDCAAARSSFPVLLRPFLPALLVGDGAAGLAGGLAGSLAFAAGAGFCKGGFLNGANVFHDSPPMLAAGA